MPMLDYRTARICIFLFLLAPLVLAGCWRQTSELPASALRHDGVLTFLCTNNLAAPVIDIEIADSAVTRAKGLMGRMLRNDTEGMLFIFETPGIQKFWMRNTPGSLDMIFVAKDYRIVNIAEQTLPLSDRTYSSAGSVAYVVEVKGGFARRFGIDESCRIRWQRH